jgi:hypothetical protein
VNVREKEIAPQLAVSLSTSIIHVDWKTSGQLRRKRDITHIHSDNEMWKHLQTQADYIEATTTNCRDLFAFWDKGRFLSTFIQYWVRCRRKMGKKLKEMEHKRFKDKSDTRGWAALNKEQLKGCSWERELPSIPFSSSPSTRELGRVWRMDVTHGMTSQNYVKEEQVTEQETFVKRIGRLSLFVHINNGTWILD